ncbi:PIG-L family deacetylase [archaeon]|nr:PIG-L family deacetylase [archaeon]
MKKMKILIVAAHPDDEILGCGATAARFIEEGNEVYTLILGEGVTSRDVNRDIHKRKSELISLKKEIESANGIIGVKEFFLYDFPDNRFDSVPLLDIVKVIEGVKDKIKPNIIFTHFENDLNIDHQITYKAVITATRPIGKDCVNEIYSFEVPSSTEWNFPNKFSPDVFFDVSETIQKKISAMAEYNSELKDFPHPRSLEGIKLIARYRGLNVGKKFVESFKCVRKIC